MPGQRPPAATKGASRSSAPPVMPQDGLFSEVAQ